MVKIQFYTCGRPMAGNEPQRDTIVGAKIGIYRGSPNMSKSQDLIRLGDATGPTFLILGPTYSF